MFTTEGEVHSALAFEASVTVVGSATFGLDAHSAFVCLHALVIVHIQILDGETVTSFPVVAVVEYALE